MSADPYLAEQLNLMLQKSRRALHAARQHVSDGDYDFAASRSYYAAFYALETVLLAVDLTFSKHSVVLGAFNHHFIKTNKFPQAHSKRLARLFRERQVGDYDFGDTITKEEAEKTLRTPSKSSRITDYLIREKFIFNATE